MMYGVKNWQLKRVRIFIQCHLCSQQLLLQRLQSISKLFVANVWVMKDGQ